MIPDRYWFTLKPHLAIWGTAWLAGAFLLALQGYNQSFLTLNALHHPALDAIMPHFTHLGDGVLPVTAFALMIAHRDRGLILSTLIALVTGVVLVTLLKEHAFHHWHRPPVVFGKEHIHYITRQDELYNSFPSGHSQASALTGVFCALSFHHFRRWWSVLTAMTAIGICYSRIYIGVHFLGDVLAGSAIGLVVGVGVMTLLTPVLERWFARMKPVWLTTWSAVLYILAATVMVYDVLRLAEFY